MTRQRGQLAESYAQHYLEQQGLILEANNYRCPAGEIDLIMWHQGVMVFIEVRYRAEADFGASVETISQGKRQRLIRTARRYLLEKQLTDKVDCRFDVVGMLVNEGIDWIQNAFEVRY